MMDELMSFEKAQAFTRIKVSTLPAWAARRRIEAARLGRRVKTREGDLEKSIESNIVPARPDRGE